MYEVSKAVQRTREHSESALSLFDYSLERSPCGLLLRCGETELQPRSEAQVVTDDRVDCLIFLLRGELTASDGLTPVHLAAESLLIFRASPQEEALRMSGGAAKGRFLQVLLMRARSACAEGAVTQKLNPKLRRGTLQPVASGQSHADALELDSDSAVYLSHLRPGEQVAFETLIHRRSYIYVLEGTLRVENERLHPGDSLRTYQEAVIPLSSSGHCQFVFVDLPAAAPEERDRQERSDGVNVGGASGGDLLC